MEKWARNFKPSERAWCHRDKGSWTYSYLKSGLLVNMHAYVHAKSLESTKEAQRADGSNNNSTHLTYLPSVYKFKSVFL